MSTGQSIGLGWDSKAISTASPFKNLKLEDRGPEPKYPIDGSGSPAWAMVPLLEPIRVMAKGSGPGYDDSGQYPNNIFNDYLKGDYYGETPTSGMANTISKAWAAKNADDYVTVHSVVGWSGHCLASIDKKPDNRNYQASLVETTQIKKLATAAGKSYGVAGLVLTHGECDATNQDYGAGVYRLLKDYNADLKGITGQKRDVILFVSQESNTEGGPNSSAVQVLKLSNQHPGEVICTGPKYHYQNINGVHMPAADYERIGEKYGQVFDLVINQGVSWKPLGPRQVTRAGAAITISFNVPAPPLVWESHGPANHQTSHAAWAKGHGFEVKDDQGNELTIASAEIKGDSVVLSLDKEPDAAKSLQVAYAITQDGTGNLGGEEGGLHGDLRDSDPFVGYDTESITLQVTSGSRSITAGKDVLAHRGRYDLVSGDGVPPDTVLTSVSYGNGDQAELSAPWPGASGMVKLDFRHDMYNYCVHFSLAVP